MQEYNPKQITEQLKVILSSPSKKIGFLFGAGISMKKSDGTDLIKSTKDILTEIKSTFSSEPEKSAISAIESEVISNGKEFNIESLLSKISEKAIAAGVEKLCGLSKEELENLRKGIEEIIKNIVSVHNSVKVDEINHLELAKWIRNAHREFPVEIFTTNYDYLLEIALENQKIQYFDGFVGNYRAFFCSEWIDDHPFVRNWLKLWKLHGSLGWTLFENNVVRSSGSSGNEAMIYPSFLKYDRSRKQPYLSYMDRLSSFLKQKDTILFICGYSFGDEHINDILMTALTGTDSANIIIFKRDDINETDYITKEIGEKSPRISIYGKKHAVIGCKFGEWKLISKDDNLDIFKEDKAKTDEGWDGKGSFLLGDFKEFVGFLSKFYSKNNF